MAARPRMTGRSKALRLDYWNADRFRGRKHELEHFLNQQGVDIFLLSETLLNPGQAFRLANYSATAQTDSGRRYRHPGPPWYSPKLNARSGLGPLGGYCQTSQTGEYP